MKRLLLLLTIAVLTSCATPKKHIDTGTEVMSKYSLRHAALPASLAFVAGASNGLNQTLLHHYGAFKSRFPGAHDRYWNPQQSWHNKYRAGDPANGPAYWGATTFLVAATDGYHLSNCVSRSALFAAGCTVTIGQRRPWWHYAADIGLSYLTFSIGFHSVYSWYF